MNYRFIVVLLSLFMTATPVAAAVKSPHCHKTCPAAAWGDALVVRHHGFTLAPNPSTKIAEWVAYKVTRQTLGPARPRRWRADPLLADSQTLEPGDYRGAARIGYDRGHLAPLASLSGGEAWAETNFVSNLAPQRRAFNRGPWARLEVIEWTLVMNQGYDVVYVVVRPLYEHDMPPLPGADEAHVVPSGFLKTITAIKGSQVWRKTVRFDQDQRSGSVPILIKVAGGGNK